MSTMTELLTDILTVSGGDVESLPDTSLSTLYKAIIVSCGGSVDDLPDGLKTTFLKRIVESIASGGSTGGENKLAKVISDTEEYEITASDLEGVTTIKQSAFAYSAKLKSIVIPDIVTSIGDSVFDTCTGLTSVTIGNGVSTIGNYAFMNCTGLENITIGNGVTSIGEYAFYYCTGLKNITIPNSVTRIGEYAFEGCSKMEYYDFTSHTSVPTLANANVFNTIPSTCQIRVKPYLVDEWKATTNWSNYVNNIKGW